MGVKFSNNGHSTLASSITSSDTSITVASGHGARFPSLGAGDYFYATLIDASNNLEIVKCTARSSDVLTVTRGQESTTARAYAIGDRIELRVTAQGITDATDIDTILPSQTSNSGKFLTTDGTNSSWGTVPAAYGLQSQQVFTSSGTWTKPAGITKIKVIVTGGGAGGTAIEIIDVTSVSTVSVTVGAGGSPGSGGAEGSDGGTSSFGSYCSATGGEKGGAPWSVTTDNGTKGNGGVGTGGDINLTGGDGGPSGGGDIKDEASSGANGGASYWGGGGQAGASVSTVNSNNYEGKNGKAYGSGGGGGDDDSGSSFAGGAGKAGIVVVEEYA